MKLNFFSKFILLTLTFIVLSEICLCVSEIEKEEISSKNIWGKFTEGIIDSISDGSSGWSKCLPDAWNTEAENSEQEEQNLLDKIFKGIKRSVKKINLNFGRFNTSFCSKKKMAEIFWGFAFKDTDPKLFLEGQFVKRNVENKLYNYLKKKVSSGSDWTEDNLNNAWKTLGTEAQNLAAIIIKSVIKYKNYIVAFFKSKPWKKVLEIIKCITNRKVMKSWETLDNFSKKSRLISTSSITVNESVKIVLGILCSQDHFTSMALELKEIGKKEKAKKFRHYGSLIGRILNFAATISVTQEK